MYSFYLPRGHNLENLINLQYAEKYMYKLSMEKFNKEEAEKYKQLFGES